MHISQNPDTTKKLLHSVEMGYYQRQLTVLGVFFLILCAIAFFRDPGVGIAFVILFLPFLIFYLYRIFRILRQKDNYIFCTAVLDQPNYHFWHKTYSFTVTLDHPQISSRSRQTQPIFMPYGVFEPLLVNYVNQPVTVAYNPLTETLVVIG